MMINRSSMGGPSFIPSLLVLTRGNEDGNPIPVPNGCSRPGTASPRPRMRRIEDSRSLARDGTLRQL